jgi:hypothetical protein
VKFGTDIDNKHTHLKNTYKMLFVSQNCKHGDGPMLLSYIRHIQLMLNQYVSHYVFITILKNENNNSDTSKILEIYEAGEQASCGPFGTSCS